MDINFHYFVTYQAAVEAGFPPEKAIIIARAAQFVDENSESFINGFQKAYPGFGEGEKVCPTVQTTAELLGSDFKDFWKRIIGSKEEIKKIARIWPVFHFLPGDYEFVRGTIKPDIETNGSYVAKLGTRLVCAPESRIVKKMVTFVRDYCRDGSTSDRPGERPNERTLAKLLRIGITMHVLADTFAHQRFTGLPSAELNDVGRVLMTDGYGLEPLEKPSWMPAIDAWGRRAFSPTSLSSTSFGYLGHGRIGHVPDEPGAVFGYHPAWDSSHGIETDVFRANYIEFLAAYEQMIAAIEFILGETDDFNERVDKSEYERAQVYNPAARPVGMTDERERVILRLQKIMQLFAYAKKDSDLKHLWCDHYDIEIGDYAKPKDVEFVRLFNIEAEKHQSFVIGEVPALLELLRM